MRLSSESLFPARGSRRRGCAVAPSGRYYPRRYPKGDISKRKKKTMKTPEEIRAAAEEIRARRKNADAVKFIKNVKNALDDAIVARAENKPGADEEYTALVRKIGRIVAKWALTAQPERDSLPYHSALIDCVLGNDDQRRPLLIDDRSFYDLLGADFSDAIRNFSGWAFHYDLLHRNDLRNKISEIEKHLNALRIEIKADEKREEYERAAYDRRKRILTAWAADGDEIPQNVDGEPEAKAADPNGEPEAKAADGDK